MQTNPAWKSQEPNTESQGVCSPELDLGERAPLGLYGDTSKFAPSHAGRILLGNNWKPANFNTGICCGVVFQIASWDQQI